MFNKTEKKTKQIVEEFFQKTSFEVSVEIGEVSSEPEEGRATTVPVSLKTESPQVLIGEGGRTLFCLQLLLNKIIKKQISEKIYLDLDINDYKKKKTDYLKELARSYADDVALTGASKELRAMPPYERRVIHLELQKRSDIKTESAGEEPFRRIIIKPA